ALFPPLCPASYLIFFFTSPATTQFYTLSLHDALPIFLVDDALAGCLVQLLGGDLEGGGRGAAAQPRPRTASPVVRSAGPRTRPRSEEHTSELQSRSDLVCRLLLEKKKNTKS